MSHDRTSRNESSNFGAAFLAGITNDSKNKKIKFSRTKSENLENQNKIGFRWFNSE